MHLYALSAFSGIITGTLLTGVQAGLLMLAGSVLLVVLRGRFHGACRRTSGMLLLGLAGLLYAQIWLQIQLQHRLPVSADRSHATLRLQLLEVETRPQSVRMLAQVLDQGDASGVPVALRQVQLNWYRPEWQPYAGMRLQAEVVLRSPRQFSNGLPFDYEAYLLSRGVDASGYIRSAVRLPDSPLSASGRALWLQQRQLLYRDTVWPWIAGLVLGEQSAFDAAQWQLAQRTGTLHLLVVSGLHVGLVILLLLGLFQLSSRLLVVLSRRSFPSLLLWRSLFLLSGSAAYVWLAGQGVALQRAWLMLAIAVILLNSRLQVNWLSALTLAACGVLLVNPLIWARPGFGFSFMAVAALLLFFGQRRQGRLESLWLPQWVVFCAMLPLFLFWQQPVSLVQVLANLIAIPLLTLVLLPLTLLTAWFPLAGLQAVLEVLGDGFWQGLHLMDSIPLSLMVSMPWYVLLAWPFWLGLLRAGVRPVLLWPALVLVLAGWFLRTPPVPDQVTMLDVGQGQSLVFTAMGQALVYDTGPAFSPQFDAGTAIVRPFLHGQGVRRLDVLVVSHSDNDHAGGTASLLAAFPVTEFWAGQPLPVSARRALLCHAADSRWQVVNKQLLYRFLLVPDAVRQRSGSDNDQSCVVQVSWSGVRFLLPGDIGREAEQTLVARYGAGLRSDILLLSHHGSRSSSSQVFLQTVQPQEVWISAGFHNRFGHPAEAVLARLQTLGIPWRNTAVSGAVRLPAAGTVQESRSGWQPPWRQP